jgi:hypothetical protein
LICRRVDVAGDPLGSLHVQPQLTRKLLVHSLWMRPVPSQRRASMWAVGVLQVGTQCDRDDRMAYAAWVCPAAQGSGQFGEKGKFARCGSVVRVSSASWKPARIHAARRCRRNARSGRDASHTSRFSGLRRRRVRTSVLTPLHGARSGERALFARARFGPWYGWQTSPSPSPSPSPKAPPPPRRSLLFVRRRACVGVN